MATYSCNMSLYIEHWQTAALLTQFQSFWTTARVLAWRSFEIDAPNDSTFKGLLDRMIRTEFAGQIGLDLGQPGLVHDVQAFATATWYTGSQGTHEDARIVKASFQGTPSTFVDWVMGGTSEKVRVIVRWVQP